MDQQGQAGSMDPQGQACSMDQQRRAGSMDPQRQAGSMEKQGQAKNELPKQYGRTRDGMPRVLKPQVRWENLYFYQKSDVIYQMAFVFCDRFIHLYRDRTRDQVIQAARSCKQNIVEGLADGVTSTEMQLKLLNVARASLKELREDFEDYIKSRHLKFYGVASENKEGESAGIVPDCYYDGDIQKYDRMLDYCRRHNKLAEYEPFFQAWTDEEMCNYGVTLCHMIDKMMISFMEKLEHEFITEGGIKERMYKARTGFRSAQDERLRHLEEQRPKLEQRIAELEQRIAEQEQQKARLSAQLAESSRQAQKWHDAYEDLKQRALAAYNRQQEEIKRLRGDK